MSNQLQRDLDAFIKNWKPSDSVIFKIDLSNTLTNVSSVKIKNANIIFRFFYEINSGAYEYYFALNRSVLQRKFDAKGGVA